MNKKVEFKRNILKTVNNFIGFTGFEIVRQKTKKTSGYIPLSEVLNAARELNLSVCDYLERIWGKAGDTERVVAEMGEFGIFSDKLDYICEIGTGSGRYLEKIMNLCNPILYESYETAKDWADFLERGYSVVSHDADGRSLRYTKSSSVDLVHAHGLFVYIPFLTTYQYFLEIARVIRHNGYVVFDIFSEQCFDNNSLTEWLKSEQNYPSFLSKKFVASFFQDNGFTLIGEFFNRYGPGISHYMIFKKQRHYE